MGIVLIGSSHVGSSHFVISVLVFDLGWTWRLVLVLLYVFVLFMVWFLLRIKSRSRDKTCKVPPKSPHLSLI